MKPSSQSFGSTIRQRRIQLGLTQAEVGAAIGKQQSQIVRLERGLADPRLSNVVEVSRAVGMEMVAVPLRLLPAVRHLIAEHEQDGSVSRRGRLVGNDPEDAEDRDAS